MNPDRTYTFRCPTCKQEVSFPDPGEPLCDGPGWMKGHEPAVMRRIRVKDKELGTKEVSAAEAEERVRGALLTPEVIMGQKLKAKGKLWTPKEKDENPWTGDEVKDEG